MFNFMTVSPVSSVLWRIATSELLTDGHSLLSEGGECALGFPKIMVSKLLYSSAFSAEVKIRRRTAEPTGFP